MVSKNKFTFGRVTKAFTLVELIVVITILAILGTIGFVSFQGYSSSARDSVRISDLTNIQKGLELYQLNAGSYPSPDDITGIGTINGEELTYVGNIGDNISRMIKISPTPTDPLSNITKYIYGTSFDKRYYQIATIMESTEANLKLIDKAYAADSTYKTKVIGNYKGILRKRNTVYNIPGLVFTGSGNLLSDITYFAVNKSSNLPYTTSSTTPTNTQTGSQILSFIGNTSSTITGVTITDWNTQSGTLVTSIGYPIDTIGVAYYGDTYFTEIKDQEIAVVEIPEATTVNGDCGSSNGTTVATEPTTNLCGDSSAPTRTTYSTGWTWSCIGSGNPIGTTAGCSANKILAGDVIAQSGSETALYAGVYTGGHGKTLWVAGTESTSLKWQTLTGTTANTSSGTDGRANTGVNDINYRSAISGTRTTNHPAGDYCANLNWAGYSDWYIPAGKSTSATTSDCGNQSGEIQFLYCKHKESIGLGFTSGLGFSSTFYFSSTEAGTDFTKGLMFNDGSFNTGKKTSNYRFHCVRVAD